MATQSPPAVRMKSIQIPADLHKQISHIAVEREAEKQGVTAEALRLGLAQMTASDNGAAQRSA